MKEKPEVNPKRYSVHVYPLCEYTNLEYVRIHVIYRANQAGEPILFVNTLTLTMYVSMSYTGQTRRVNSRRVNTHTWLLSSLLAYDPLRRYEGEARGEPGRPRRTHCRRCPEGQGLTPGRQRGKEVYIYIYIYIYIYTSISISIHQDIYIHIYTYSLQTSSLKPRPYTRALMGEGGIHRSISISIHLYLYL